MAVIGLRGARFRYRLRILLTGTAASLGFLTATAAAAHAYVYWANRGGTTGTTIGRANLDGMGANLSFVNGATGPVGVAVDGSFVYWANAFGSGTTIGRAKLDGSGVNQTFITVANRPCGVAVDGSHIYWSSYNSNSIGRANLDGTGATNTFITGAIGPCGVAVDGSHVYWANEGSTTIGRANLNGSNPSETFIGGASQPTGVAVNGSHIYWGNNNASTMGRANLDGSQATESFIAGTGTCIGFPAVDATYIYWANDCDGSIGRAKLDGSGVTEDFISTLSNPAGVAVDQLAPLTVSLAGTGAGSVTGAGISCPSGCSGSYTLGQQVTLTATPASSTFAGWSGAGCSGTGTCTITIGAEQAVTATFTAKPKQAEPKCILRVKSSKVLLPPLKKQKRNHKPMPSTGTLTLTVKCDQAASVTLTGRLTEPSGKKPKQGKQRTKTISLPSKHRSVPAGASITFTIKLPNAALTALGHGARESVAFTLVAKNANGTRKVTTKVSRLRAGH